MQLSAPLREVRFVMHEVLGAISELNRTTRYQQIDKETLDSVITEFSQFATEEILPVDRLADQDGCIWRDGKVYSPAHFVEAWKKYRSLGWPLLCANTEHGGLQLPSLVFSAISEMTAFASHAFVMTSAVNHCALACLLNSASQELQDRWIQLLASGEALSSMCMSEPSAGSDLGLITTRARPEEGGTYRISGSKIFASGAEHNLTDNILHLVLARLPDAPAGARGLSLFLVPKRAANGALNGVICDGIEHKMGLHGSPTCTLRFEHAQGWLVGAPHAGLRALFPMMNEARLLSGLQAIGISEKALQMSQAYALERRQGRAGVDPGPCRLIDHVDVQRMLMTQRAWTEGARVLAQWTALLIDQAKWHDDEAERNNANTLLELLTPIVKGFLSENAQFSTSLALQVFGGHGYVTETGIEQLVRDVRITTIYEGTTGIQAQDLLMRKIVSSNGERFQVLDEQLTRWLRESGSDPGLEAFTSPLRSLQQRVGRITAELLAKERSHPGWALGACTNYLRLIGHLVLAWSWARIARAAQAHENSGDSWYALKLETAQFYFSQLAPETLALEQAIQAGLADNSDMLTRVIEDF